MFYFSAIPGIVSTHDGRRREGGHTDTVGEEPAVAPGVDPALLSEDTRMLTLLYERFRRPIYTYLYRLLGNQEDAADATQEVFLRACMHWEKLRDRESLGEWLYRVATNLCIDLLRKRKRLSWWPLTHHSREDEGDEEEGDEDTLTFLSADHGGMVMVAEREHAERCSRHSLPGNSEHPRLITRRDRLAPIASEKDVCRAVSAHQSGK